jgi:cytochrome c553
MRALAGVASVFVAVFSFSAWGADAMGDAKSGKAKAGLCAACHGADGNSVNPVWPKLAGQNARYIVRQAKAIKTAGGGRDTPEAGLMRPMVQATSDKDLQDIAAFYAAQTGTTETASAEKLAQGEKLFRGGDTQKGIPACMSCHGPSGAGNPLAGYPKLSGQHVPYTTGQLKSFRAGARTTDPNGMMRMIAQKLSDGEIAAVANFISGLHD